MCNHQEQIGQCFGIIEGRLTGGSSLFGPAPQPCIKGPSVSRHLVSNCRGFFEVFYFRWVSAKQEQGIARIAMIGRGPCDGGPKSHEKQKRHRRGVSYS